MHRNNSSNTLQPYTTSEVEKHNTETDAWITIDGYVHNITSFLAEHPGGREIVLPYLGADATDIFVSEKEHVHSAAAFSVLRKYRIGVLSDGRVRERVIMDKRLASLVDVNKPMVPQIWKLGEDYQDWIHSQAGLEKIIIFDNVLEKFSRWPWWYIFILWTPIILYNIFRSWYIDGVSAPKVGGILVVGIMTWGLIEYVLHRFIFHVRTSSPAGNMFHFFIHGIHHITPMDSTRLTFPPMFALFVGYAIFGFFGFFFSPPTGLHAAFAGGVLGYLFYDSLHYYFHHGDVAWMPEPLKKMKSLHLNHHYKDDTKNYGVTSPLFDYILGTA